MLIFPLLHLQNTEEEKKKTYDDCLKTSRISERSCKVSTNYLSEEVQTQCLQPELLCFAMYLSDAQLLITPVFFFHIQYYCYTGNTGNKNLHINP